MNKMHIRGRGASVDYANLHGAVAAAPALRDPSSRVIPIITEYLTIARRRKWLIVGTVVTALVVGLIITLLMTPQYSAKATLEIQRESFNIVKVEGVQPEASPLDMEFYQTQYGLLRSTSLAERVATDLKLGDSQQFFEFYGIPEAKAWFEDGRVRPGESSSRDRMQKAAEVLLENLGVTPIRLSRLVDIYYTSPDPDFSARVVNAWTEHFIEASLARRFEATSYAREFLEERLGQLRERLDQSERLLVAYASRQGIINLPPSGGAEGSATNERSIVSDDLVALNRELAQATADRVQAQSRLRTSGASVNEALQNDAINGLRQRRAELASEYSKLLVQFEPEYPPARALQSQIQQLDRAISTEVGRVQGTLQQNYRASASREAALQQRVNALKSDLLDLRRRSIQYNIYQRDVDTNQQLYDGLLQRYKEIGIAGGVGANNIAVVDPASVPEKPSSPNLVFNMLVALLGGLALGAGLALAIEQMDEAIADPTEVEKALGLPLLGAIPKVHEGTPVEALRDRKSPMAEAYLSVRTNLAFSTDHGAPRSLAVTSTRPGEGKTTTSFAVANSLARTKRTVLLVDADMRSPSVHHILGIQNDRGLSNYLAGDDDLNSLLLSDAVYGLTVMTAGPQPPNAAELLTSDRLSKMIQDLLKRFDHVIFDAPPVMGLADAPVLGSQMEGAIFVVESHGTRAAMARVSVARLAAAQVHVIGSVLTKFDAKRAHYGYGYDYGYGYGETPKATA